MNSHVSYTASDVSAVVCSWNAESSIEACVKSLRECNVKEIILVDANSSDRTRELAQHWVDQIVTDPMTGLGNARNMGIAHTSGKYVLNCGVDNVMPSGSVEAMLRFKEEGGFAGVSALTILNGSGYLSWALDQYKRARFFPGERPVIGTPTLFNAETIKEYPYDGERTWSDDAELCERWTRK